MQPNILFVFADQMRGMDMGCAGNAQVHTPNLDRLAAEGTLFRRAYANIPVCGPSRACLLTGQYPLTHTVIANDLPLPEEAVTVGELFRDAGYRTGYIGKWHLDGIPREKWTPPGPRRHGFEFWAAYNCSHDYYRLAKYYRDDPQPVEVEGYEPVVQTDLALEFLAEPDPRPFCLFLSWGPPHDPYPMVPEEYRRLYDPKSLQLHPNVCDIPPGPNSLAKDMDCRETVANYYAAITALDAQMGRLVHHLDTFDLADNTIVIFTSDHGDMLWSQGKMKKQQPWEESIHIPFLLRWPGRVPAGHVDPTLLSIVDFAPSLLGLAGIDLPLEMQGTDLSPAMIGLEQNGPDSVFLMDIVPVDENRKQGLPAWRGVRTARYTYARLPDGTGWLLYDNLEDPYQLINCIDDPAFAAIRAGLDEMLDDWLRRTGDPFVDGKEHIRRLGLVAAWNAREELLDPGGKEILCE